MLLNHEESIEFMVDALPTKGDIGPVVRNVQSLLAREPPADPANRGHAAASIVPLHCAVPQLHPNASGASSSSTTRL